MSKIRDIDWFYIYSKCQLEVIDNNRNQGVYAPVFSRDDEIIDIDLQPKTYKFDDITLIGMENGTGKTREVDANADVAIENNMLKVTCMDNTDIIIKVFEVKPAKIKFRK